MCAYIDIHIYYTHITYIHMHTYDIIWISKSRKGHGPPQKNILATPMIIVLTLTSTVNSCTLRKGFFEDSFMMALLCLTFQLSCEPNPQLIYCRTSLFFTFRTYVFESPPPREDMPPISPGSSSGQLALNLQPNPTRIYVEKD